MQLNIPQWLPLFWISLCRIAESYSQEAAHNLPTNNPHDLSVHAEVKVGMKPITHIGSHLAQKNSLGTLKDTRPVKTDTHPIKMMKTSNLSTPNTLVEVRKTRRIVKKNYSSQRSRRFSAILLKMCAADYRRMADEYHQIWLNNQLESNQTFGENFPGSDASHKAVSDVLTQKLQEQVPNEPNNRKPLDKNSQHPEKNHKSLQGSQAVDQSQVSKDSSMGPAQIGINKTGARVMKAAQGNNLLAPSMAFKAEGQMKNDAILGPENVLKGSLHAGTDENGEVYMHGQHSLGREAKDEHENTALGSNGNEENEKTKPITKENINANMPHDDASNGINDVSKSAVSPDSKTQQINGLHIVGVKQDQNKTENPPKGVNDGKNPGTQGPTSIDNYGSVQKTTLANISSLESKSSSVERKDTVIDNGQQGKAPKTSGQVTNNMSQAHVSTKPAAEISKQVDSQKPFDIYSQDTSNPKRKETSASQSQKEKKEPSGEQISTSVKSTAETRTLSHLEKALMIFEINETTTEESQAPEVANNYQEENVHSNGHTANSQDNAYTPAHQNQQTPSDNGEKETNPEPPEENKYTLTTENHMSSTGGGEEADHEPYNSYATGNPEENTENNEVEGETQPEPQSGHITEGTNEVEGETKPEQQPGHISEGTNEVEGETQPEPQSGHITEGTNEVEGETKPEQQPGHISEGTNEVEGETQPEPQSDHITEGTNEVEGETKPEQQTGHNSEGTNEVEGSPAYPQSTPDDITGNPAEYTGQPEINSEPQLKLASEGNEIHDDTYGSPAYAGPTGYPEEDAQPPENQPPSPDQVSEGNDINSASVTGIPEPEPGQATDGNTGGTPCEETTNAESGTEDNMRNEAYGAPSSGEKTGIENPDLNAESPAPQIDQVTQSNSGVGEIDNSNPKKNEEDTVNETSSGDSVTDYTPEYGASYSQQPEPQPEPTSVIDNGNTGGAQPQDNQDAQNRGSSENGQEDTVNQTPSGESVTDYTPEYGASYSQQPEPQPEPASVIDTGNTGGAQLQDNQDTQNEGNSESSQGPSEGFQNGEAGEGTTVAAEPQINQDAYVTPQLGDNGNEQSTLDNSSNEDGTTQTPKAESDGVSYQDLSVHNKDNLHDNPEETTAPADSSEVNPESSSGPYSAHNTPQENNESSSEKPVSQEYIVGQHNLDSSSPTEEKNLGPTSNSATKENETDHKKLESVEKKSEHPPNEQIGRNYQPDKNDELENHSEDETNVPLHTETPSKPLVTQKFEVVKMIPLWSTTPASNVEATSPALKKNEDIESPAEKISDHKVTNEAKTTEHEKVTTNVNDSPNSEKFPKKTNTEEESTSTCSTAKKSQHPVGILQPVKQQPDQKQEDLNRGSFSSSSSVTTTPSNNRHTTLADLEKSKEEEFTPTPKETMTAEKLKFEFSPTEKETEKHESSSKATMDITEGSTSNVSLNEPKESFEKVLPEPEPKSTDKEKSSDQKNVDLTGASNIQNANIIEPPENIIEPVFSAEKTNTGAQKTDSDQPPETVLTAENNNLGSPGNQPQVPPKVKVQAPPKLTGNGRSQFNTSLRIPPSRTGDIDNGQGWGLFNGRAKVQQANGPVSNNGQYNFFANLFVTQTPTITTTTTPKPVQMRKAPAPDVGKYKWGWF